ncbi:MAG: hypothetical protein EZS28_040955 [Streblomastix strix]|uniref:Uncharacterized protein n=1 Tax=Streblomastix strix TaxID=222440 RepID=A0A5J4TZG2_9EUKA|nr:MAG: hypothetical protein EZS28_040955 [Streblomastix strix]
MTLSSTDILILSLRNLRNSIKLFTEIFKLASGTQATKIFKIFCAIIQKYLSISTFFSLFGLQLLSNQLNIESYQMPGGAPIDRFNVEITPLGAGNEVGRSCIFVKCCNRRILVCSH